MPNRKLLAFDKVALRLAGSAQACFSVTDADVALVDDAGATVVYVILSVTRLSLAVLCDLDTVPYQVHGVKPSCI